jgi:hypothetical protein
MALEDDFPPVDYLLAKRPTSWRGVGRQRRMLWGHFDTYLRNKLAADGPPGPNMEVRRRIEFAWVVEALRPHTLPADAAELVPVAGAPRVTVSSHFGGLPYMERDEPWPRSAKTGELLSFVGQISPREFPNHPCPELGLVTLFVDEDNFLEWSDFTPSRDSGVLVARGYAAPSLDQARSLEGADQAEAHVQCVPHVRTIPTLPHWRELESRLPEEARDVLEHSTAWFGSRLWDRVRQELGVATYLDRSVQVGGHGDWWQDSWDEPPVLQLTDGVASTNATNWVYGVAYVIRDRQRGPTSVFAFIQS